MGYSCAQNACVCKGNKQQFTALLHNTFVIPDDISILKFISIFWASLMLKV